MLKTIVAKTPASIFLSKVKGHAKGKHIEAGIATREQAEGNDRSDGAAEDGHSTGGRPKPGMVTQQQRYGIEGADGNGGGQK